jgi:transcriptional regulator with XRE-family HTH domain
MNAPRIGRVLRAVRLHQRLSQRAVAKRARISQSVYSRAERGDIGGMTVKSLDRLTEALGASLHLDIRYRGGLGDRLADAAHAGLVDLVVSVLRGAGWLVELEFGFNGSAGHAAQSGPEVAVGSRGGPRGAPLECRHRLARCRGVCNARESIDPFDARGDLRRRAARTIRGHPSVVALTERPHRWCVAGVARDGAATREVVQPQLTTPRSAGTAVPHRMGHREGVHRGESQR